LATVISEYELILMLDPEVEDERRDQITSEARQRIESAGTLKHDSAWGMRKLAYEIRQRTEADYRFFRFQTGGELLDQLNHNLRIEDGVLRFRIFKVDPRSPVIVPPAPSPTGAPPPRGPRRGAPDAPAPEAPAAEAPAAAEAAAPAAEQPAPTAEAPAAAEAAAPADEQPAEAAEPAAPAEAPAPAEEAPAAEESAPVPDEAAPPAEPPADEQ
jgi:small subunit ribosomal protein S6